MVIVWRDTDLKEHRIDLTNAVDVKIEEIGITVNGECSLRIHTDGPIKVLPIASNAITVKTERRAELPSKDS